MSVDNSEVSPVTILDCESQDSWRRELAGTVREPCGPCIVSRALEPPTVAYDVLYAQVVEVAGHDDVSSFQRLSPCNLVLEEVGHTVWLVALVPVSEPKDRP